MKKIALTFFLFMQTTSFASSSTWYYVVECGFADEFGGWVGYVPTSNPGKAQQMKDYCEAQGGVVFPNTITQTPDL